MRMSHTNYKNVIEGLGGDPMRFLLLLVHTLNVFINKFASGARNFFFIFQCHTVTNGTDLRRSPHPFVSNYSAPFPLIHSYCSVSLSDTSSFENFMLSLRLERTSQWLFYGGHQIPCPLNW